MIKNILIPTDGSEYANSALDYGIYLAGKTGAGLIGLHVVDIRLLQPPLISDISGTLGLPLYQEFSDSLENDLEEKAEAILRAFRHRCQAAGLSPAIKKITGIIEERIIEEAKTADLIIMAKRGEHVRREMTFLGSITEFVVNASGRPVLVTPAEFQPINKMALAYDGSPSAEKALKLSAELAGNFGWSLQTIIIANDRQKATDLRGKAGAGFTVLGRQSEITLLTGRENKQLISFIRGGAVQLLAMGAYGHNKLRRLLLGSTTSYVIRNSSIPVLLTR
jgi:nucleotide-binding universal stress UspA family protein